MRVPKPENNIEPKALISNVDGHRIFVLRPLGVGGEGRVFLVDTDHGLAVLKDYHSLSIMEQSLTGYSGPNGKLLPRLLAVDRSSSAVLMEYWEGIPVDMVMAYGEDIGMTTNQIDMVEESWKDWVKVNTPNSRFNGSGMQPFDYNVIYSPRDGAFYFIDPR